METTYHLQIPKVLYQGKYYKLNNDVKLLYSWLLYNIRHSKYPYYFLETSKRADIADMFGCSVRTIGTRLKVLKDNGLIDIKKNVGKGVRIYNKVSGLTKKVGGRDPQTKQYNYDTFPFYKLHTGLFYMDKPLTATQMLAYAYIADGYDNAINNHKKLYFYLTAKHRRELQYMLGLKGRELSTIDNCISELKNRGLITTNKGWYGVCMVDKGADILRNDYASFYGTICGKIKGLNDNTLTNRATYDYDHSKNVSENVVEYQPKTNSQVKPIIPKMDDVRAYFSEWTKYFPDSIGLNPLKFYQYYQAKNWLDNNGLPIRNWQKWADKWIYGSYVSFDTSYGKHTYREFFDRFKYQLDYELVNSIEKHLTGTKNKYVTIADIRGIRKYIDRKKQLIKPLVA